MTSRPHITFVPYYAGSELHHAMLGEVRVGAIHGKRWLCALSQTFMTTGHWKDARSELAAKNDLIAAVRDWCRLAGLTGLVVAE